MKFTNKMNFIVYDFETTGISARFDQILQGGFIVYDSNFKEIERLNIRSRLSPDIVPSINALRVNRLKMAEVLSEKLTFYDMTNKIRQFLSKYKDCFFVGFNSINFDEEFLRQLFWEHFYFPYLSNTNGNFRGDLLNLVTMVNAFNSDTFEVQKNDNGKISFKLEKLAKANNFDTSNSHEAIADVEVTLRLMELIAKKNKSFFEIFKRNSFSKNIEDTINQEDVFTLHNYLFNSHRIYLVKRLLKHPSYKNQIIAFDLKYDTQELTRLSEKELKNELKKKSFLRKIKINKQPNILSKSYSLKVEPYSNFTNEEIALKCRQLEDSDFIENINKILYKESLEYLENDNQSEKFEEDTIYSKKIDYNDSINMENFHNHHWEDKWSFAEKFKDKRLRFFAAKHIFRNEPNHLPKKVFLIFHQKISERILSLEKQSFITLPAAMEEADSISLEIEENNDDENLNEQLRQYNIYINFLNDYYKQKNPKPLKFDSLLSKQLFG